MNDSTDPRADSAADFFKPWQEAFSRMLQAAGTFNPETMPAEMMRQIRGGIFQALTKAWEEFLRSPQFLESMKQMMDNGIALRRLSTDFLTRARQETQGTSRQDVDDLHLALREMEARLTRRVDDLAARVAAATGSDERRPGAAPRSARHPTDSPKSSPRKPTGKRP